MKMYWMSLLLVKKIAHSLQKCHWVQHEVATRKELSKSSTLSTERFNAGNTVNRHRPRSAFSLHGSNVPALPKHITNVEQQHCFEAFRCGADILRNAGTGPIR